MQSEPVAMRWTFADLASTYRFWALIGAFIAAAFGVAMFIYTLPSLPSFKDAAFISQDYFFPIWFSGNAFGLLLGMLLVRTKTTKCLAALVAVCVVCHVAAWLALPSLGAGAGMALLFFGQVVRSALAFSIAVYLAGMMTDRFAFAAAFALLTVFERFNDSGITHAALRIVSTIGNDGTAMLVGIAALTLALLFLASARCRLFDEAPAIRHRPRKPQTRVGATVSVLTALPWLAIGAVTWLGVLAPIPLNPFLYWSTPLSVALVIGLVASAYWIYCIHGEVAYIYQSSKLFTSRAALVFFLLVPLATPILLLTLGVVLREARAQRPSSNRRSMGWFNAWCVLFPPVAMGMVQEQMNELAEGQADSDSESSPQAT